MTSSQIPGNTGFLRDAAAMDAGVVLLMQANA
jgi:hypothetical protein